MEAIIETAFWASLRRVEGYSPKISLAFLPSEREGRMMTFEHPLPLTAETLLPLAPAVERPGIHLGVWRNEDNLCVWGATRTIPDLCFVLEVVAPGLLVIKYPRAGESAKFVNLAVLEGDQVKVLDQQPSSLPGCPKALNQLLGLDFLGEPADSVSVLLQLAVSMRAHGRGGTLLVVPASSDEWLQSIVRPIHYVVSPPFSRLAEAIREDAGANGERRMREPLRRVIDGIADLTTVDVATVITDRYEILAFGVKIRRREDFAEAGQVAVTEPVEATVSRVVAPSLIGGTRHISAAQFAHDQRDAVAMVASQDGRFTVFAWSPCEEMVHAHRTEYLLL
jgi:hypothetical protein